MTAFNPLLDKKPKAVNQITASVDDVIAPLSPATGRPMISARCREVECWVDPSSRLILPKRKV